MGNAGIACQPLAGSHRLTTLRPLRAVGICYAVLPKYGTFYYYEDYKAPRRQYSADDPKMPPAAFGSPFPPPMNGVFQSLLVIEECWSLAPWSRQTLKAKRGEEPHLDEPRVRLRTSRGEHDTSKVIRLRHREGSVTVIMLDPDSNDTERNDYDVAGS